MSYEFNTGMKVFSRLYVGKKSQLVEDASGDPVPGIPLGFATPYEENAAGRKRQASVDTWAKGYHSETADFPAEIIENVLAAGFKITDDIKRTYYGGGNVVFRVEDPRGFELEIQSQNLMTLIALVGLNAGGEIPGQCCWGRDGASNILIHESSEEYKQARHAAETIKPLKGIKAEFKRGDMIILTNASKVKYLGRFWFNGWSDIQDPQHVEDPAQMHPSIPPIHFTSRSFKKNPVPASEMTGHRIVQPKQYYVVCNGDRDDKVTLYREIKAVAVETAVDVEMTVEEALSFINTRSRITTASSSYGTYYTEATNSKEGLTWKTFPMTEQEFAHICELVEKSNKQYNSRGLALYENRYDQLLRSPIPFVIENEIGLWAPTYSTENSTGFREVIHKGKSTAALVRLHEADIYIHEPHAKSMGTYYHHYYRQRDVQGAAVDAFIFDSSPNDYTAPLKAWYNAGMLKTLKPIYESKK